LTSKLSINLAVIREIGIREQYNMKFCSSSSAWKLEGFSMQTFMKSFLLMTLITMTLIMMTLITTLGLGFFLKEGKDDKFLDGLGVLLEC
jgi:hypothetical protein